MGFVHGLQGMWSARWLVSFRAQQTGWAMYIVFQHYSPLVVVVVCCACCWADFLCKMLTATVLWHGLVGPCTPESRPGYELEDQFHVPADTLLSANCCGVRESVRPSNDRWIDEQPCQHGPAVRY